MDRRRVSSVAREQLLHREEAKFTLRPVVPPVALERKLISMLNPSRDSQVPVESPRTTCSTDMTSSTIVTTAPSVSPTSATAAPRVAPVSPTVITAAVPLTTVAAATASGSIVGGKRPLGEESPVSILTEQQQEDEQTETSSDVPESDSSSSQHQTQEQRAREQTVQEQSHLLKRKPEDATKILSTHQTTSERGRELDRKRSKPAVQFSDVSPKRDVSHVMKFFQEQEKHLQESFLSLPKRSQKTQRSPSPRLQQAPGLEHLDNLIRLMEQLTTLKDENSRLRKRCDFLESTKILLQAKRDLSLESSSSSSGIRTMSPQHRHHDHHHHHHDHPEHQYEKDTLTSSVDAIGLRVGSNRLTRPRISSAEELDYLELADASSDQTPKKAKTAMHKRSFSTGSLEVPSEITTEVGGVTARKRQGKSPRRIFGKSSTSKQKSKSSKWARVKKVLTGQKIYEDLGTTIRTIRELGRSSHMSYSSSGTQDIMSSSSTRMSSSETRSERRLIGGDTIRSRDISETRAALTVSPALLTESALHRFQEVGDAELTSEIWMGPPGWWEEYEANKENDATSTNSEVSSVIEVTTMYLSNKKETTTSQTITSTATAPLTSATMTQDAFLSIDKPLPRRQSSPSLVMTEPAEEDDIVRELATSVETTRLLHKSSSCKSADLDIQNFGEGKHSKKSHRSAWGRVKDIIHTRKDSIKKKPKRGKSGVDSEEPSGVDVDIFWEDQWSSDVFDDALLSRSTPKSSPMVNRQQSANDSLVGAPAGLKTSPSRLSSYLPGTSPGNVDMAALLAGSVSTEFNKKMQEWEEIRRKKSSFRVSIDESDLGSMDLTSLSHHLPDRGLDTRELRDKAPEHTSEGISHEESSATVEVLGAPCINVEEIQRRMTDSFSRKMQEWERLKYKAASSAAREPSPDGEKKESKIRKDERQKSKRSREEKEKEKWERQREREMQKVEREQVKLEKEKLRLEKERLRTLEREAKLEKLKGRLSQADMEGSFRKSVLGPLAEYKVTADFAQKLHEWELKKGLSHDVSNSIYLEAQKMSMQHLRRGGRVDPLAQQDEARYHSGSSSRTQGGDRASPPPPLTLQPYWDSPESTSPVEKDSETSLADVDDDTCTSVTEECLTRSNISSLERANKELLENLQMKELEYDAVQEEVRKVNEKLANVRERHTTEMARFHRELAKGNLTGPVNLQVEELESTVGDLEHRIQMMETFGENLASSMESAAIGKWQSIEGEETVHTQLVELVDQMRGMLAQASQSEEQSQKTMALSNFESLYTQAMKLQVQMNNLRLSHLERNREIMMIKRQLLLQEVNNLLLQADITRRETELYQFHEAKRFSSLKRWNTFSGAERQRPHTQIEQQSKPGPQQDPMLRPCETPGRNIPHITEKLVLACVVSSSISAPASPLYVTSVGDASGGLLSGATGKPLSFPGAARETSTDHVETHLVVLPPVTRRDHQLRPAVPISFTQNQVKDSKTDSSGYEAIASLQLPKLAVHISPRKYLHEQHLALPREASTTITSPPASTLPGTAETSTAAPATTATPGDARAQKISSTTRTITTICDSAPLHREIEELRREKRKVEKGPPTLKQSESQGLSTAPSPVKVPRQLSSIEAPNQTIPKQRSLEKPRLVKAAPTVDYDNSLATSVMECTESLHILEETDSELGAVGGISLEPQAAETKHDLPPTSDHSKAGSISPRSAANKQMLRRQREERQNTLIDYRAISPQSSPVAARGKPPLPRHLGSTVKPYPPTSSASDKGPRSKSVSDMEHRMADSKMSKPLQEVINRFEKRATVCETEDHPIELRKTPSPTLHLPRVGLVSRIRRLKPAAELLEESQRYRSGHSIYATRILQRYLSKDEHRPDQSHTFANKENLSGSYVQAIVQRMSHESTPVHSTGPSRANSDLSLKPNDSPKAQSELVAHVVAQFSSPSEREALAGPAPFKDDGQVKQPGQVFIGGPSSSSQERTLSDSDIDRQHHVSSSSATKAQNRRSCEVSIVLSSSPTPVSDTSCQIGPLKLVESVSHNSLKPGSTISPSSHQSLPTIALPGTGDHFASTEKAARARAATYCVSEIDNTKADGRSELTVTEQQLSTSLSSPKSKQAGSWKLSQQTGREKLSQSTDADSATSTEKAHLDRLPSPMPTDRKGRAKMGTVGVLCKQSISFDLGVSNYSQKPQTEESFAKSRQAHSWDPSDSAQHAGAATADEQQTASMPALLPLGTASTSALLPVATVSSEEAAGELRSVFTSSEGEVAPSSPTSMEKKRSRRFLDSTWLQKSKKFFKVSK